MLPLLEFAGDAQEHSMREAYDRMADKFGLSEEERRELLPSGKQPVIENRVGWARTFLTKSGLLESPRRGYFRITGSGTQVLAESPEQIDVRLLERFPAFIEFRGRRSKRDGPATLDEVSDGSHAQTPRELLERSHQQLKDDLAQELLAQVKLCSPAFFERLVVQLLLAMGYGGSLRDAGQAIGRSGDGGIDGIIKEDRLGLDVIYIQAKRWEGNVGSSEIRNFVGSLVGQNAHKGVFITTSGFSRDARDYAKTISHNVVLIDGETLAELMIDHGVGTTTQDVYEVKAVDTDYFVEG
jgi:restriction system protein